MIYIISLIFIIIILLITRQLHLRSVQLKSLQQEHDTLRERLDSLTSTVSESKLLTEPLLQSANTIHLYTALLSEESLSPAQKELQEEILQESEHLLHIVKISLL